ncbi:hypothetical protein LCGC14_2745780, partial [marine sediment metagenome]
MSFRSWLAILGVLCAGVALPDMSSDAKTRYLLHGHLANVNHDSSLTLNLDFVSRNTLDSRIAFPRASTGTCFNSAGVLTTFA